ncbi:MAG: hydrogenase maturation nickel metallochaperone HypA [Pseudomonadota bacterium]
MHELSVAQALVEQIDGIVRAHSADAAVSFRLRIGPLSGVLPELLESAFGLAAAGSTAEQAAMELVEAPVRVRCQTCGAETEAAVNRLLCGACGDWHTQLISGDELILESVELRMPEMQNS